VHFCDGFNVLTGETGAGKSILVGALNLVLGARASNEIVRSGTGSARIEAVFRVNPLRPRLAELLDTHDIELEGDELLLARVVSSEGRSRAYAGGSLIPVSVQAAIGDELVDLHGQHDHQSLLKRDRQLDLLDAYAGTESLRAEVSGMVDEIRRYTREIEALESDDREGRRRCDFLKFELTEIDQAGLEPTEEDDLRRRRERIANAEKIFETGAKVRSLLFESQESTSALDRIDEASRGMEELAGVSDEFVQLSARLDSLRAELDALHEDIRSSTETVEYDPEELERIHARLALIGDLKRKYGNTVGEILAYRDRAEDEIASFENRDARLAELTKNREEVRERAEKVAGKLSRKRAQAAGLLDTQVVEVLAGLGMEEARFHTRIENDSLKSTGADRVEFFLASNPGEEPKPLRTVASGGEMSRIMLALKAVFANSDTIPTLIFDEIDAGVGGAVAAKVAATLQGLSKSHQSICISHLPQIAAAADRHLCVSKHTLDGQTYTRIHAVNEAERIEEVARLLDGSVTQVSQDHARALLGLKKQAS
ncbi:MAG: DNA repair protein RecN, partial [Candidatus Hydrogenedentes bacterium]|nr:DNA repair protein RecN [Candidatus Hydrogenedentota bacterium]